jgi:phosphatidylinositol glycan class V
MTGIVINILCLIIGCLALYSLTLSFYPAALQPNDRHRVASAACLVYGIWNPASVFFATNYSESLFGALVLSGHMAFSQNMYWLALPCWMLASWTRSNGSIHALWFVVQCLGSICQYIQGRENSVGFVQMAANAVVYLGAAALILLPVRYHDMNGYAAHCDMAAKIRPQWCQNQSSSFSLYAWVQRQHWNVGPFHYYEVKQIPNFLLAAPILILSIVGVFSWIENSVVHFGRGKRPNSPYLLLVGWPLEALSCFVERADARTREDERTKDAHTYLISSPALLGHYAILAVLTVLSLVVAHIQISTRMIMSSTPAIVWFLTYCHLQPESTLLRRLVSVYTILFLFLGAVLHVNFLPWT